MARTEPILLSGPFTEEGIPFKGLIEIAPSDSSIKPHSIVDGPTIKVQSNGDSVWIFLGEEVEHPKPDELEVSEWVKCDGRWILKERKDIRSGDLVCVFRRSSYLPAPGDESMIDRWAFKLVAEHTSPSRWTKTWNALIKMVRNLMRR